ncbi:Outer membrane receptor proteins, mostly Fe transport [Dyadobacter koreensis]|uniref:Outer membrane receptor proteins, mostly Fe transport n=1 Tax=Dyadobacter koreensis TaxID=408657 RepID=A0A1H7A739_9BACT|nr:TonB-dependent receptor [Dyadobacter koreensis]SEJ61473.1 Outer membrane receptor proteins, mostly Fe transport [Dyadobacter koreensis]
MKTKYFLTLSLLFITSLAFCQTGAIKGQVKDSKTGEAIIGATVQILGTQSSIGSVTDIEGNFDIVKVPSGSYKVQISYVSYATKEIDNVRVEADKSTLISTSLDEDNKTLQEVVVKGQRNTNTEVSVITELKQVQQIAVGISAQQIQRTQDRDASAVIRRVPGISIFDDRFIVVRGLNERYNTVLLNDIITPSTEVDTKSFSFDLIPASAIDRMLVFKSASADLPGDVSGGAIKIYTKTVPDGNSLGVNFSVGYRAGTTFNSATSHKGGALEFLGIENGTRTLPDNFPNRRGVILNASTDAIIDRFKQLPDYYAPKNMSSVTPDWRGGINFSRRFFVRNTEVTNTSYINYSLTRVNTEVSQNRFNFRGEKTAIFNDQLFQENARLGIMSNWAFILNPKNKIEFRNLFNQMGNKETVLRGGGDLENNIDLNNGAFRYEARSIYSGQLSGTHELSEKTKLKWIGGAGYTYRNEPDFRRFTSTRQTGTNNPFTINLQQFESPTLQQAARFYSRLGEIVGTGTVTVDHLLGAKKENPEMQPKLNAGTYVEYKDRKYSARWFGIVNPNRVGSEILSLAPEQFFQNSNLASNKVYYSEGTNFDDKYAAQNLLAAGYASVYWPLTEHLNATIGFRGEYNRQQLQGFERGGGIEVNVDRPVFTPLPSLNLTYKFNETYAIRAAYSTTVNRPEFRELSPSTYYDFNFDVSRKGNPDLVNATIQNYDVRFEFYPSKSELITLSFFNKTFKNPIEAAIFYNGSTVAFTVQNAKTAYARGVELEVRKALSNPENANFLSKMLVTLNASLITSDVKTNVTTGSSDRYLQGQSPYLINTGLFYNDDAHGFQINALYNIIGKRIYIIGDNQVSANIFEMPRNVIDLNIIKAIGKHLELKASIQDLLNQPFRLVQDTNRDNKITSEDGSYQKYRRGSYSMVGLRYTF